MRRTRTVAVLPVAVVVLLGGLACSSDDSDDTTTTTAASDTTAGGESASDVRWTEEIQSELIAVGCYTGADDGILGPETDAAILAFQRAEGLAVDGEVGPETSAALKKAAADGTKVCDDSTTTTTTAETTTTAAPSGPPCTATALLEGLPDDGESVTSYVCSQGYAAGTVTGGSKFILQADGDSWAAISQDVCGSASAGIPPIILEDGCDN